MGSVSCHPVEVIFYFVPLTQVQLQHPCILHTSFQRWQRQVKTLKHPFIFVCARDCARWLNRSVV
jgi:hypothetical protein